jgi:hypothetical protein
MFTIDKVIESTRPGGGNKLHEAISKDLKSQ